MTSTTREVVPVRQVDDSPIGDGRPGPVHLPPDGRLPRLRARPLRPGGPHCRRHPVRPNQRLSSSRGTRTIVGRPCGHSVGCVVRKRSRTIALIGSAPSGCPARTAEWHASVAASRSRVPATAHSDASRSARSLRIAASAGPGSRVPSTAGTARRRVARAAEGLDVEAQLPQRLHVRVQHRAAAPARARRPRAPAVPATPRAAARPARGAARSGRARGPCAGRRAAAPRRRSRRCRSSRCWPRTTGAGASSGGRRTLGDERRARSGHRPEPARLGRLPSRQEGRRGRSRTGRHGLARTLPRSRPSAPRSPPRTARRAPSARRPRRPCARPRSAPRSSPDARSRPRGAAGTSTKTKASKPRSPAPAPRYASSTAFDRARSRTARRLTKRRTLGRGGRGRSGRETKPRTVAHSEPPSTGTRSSSIFAPNTWKSRAASPSTGGVSSTVRPPDRSEKPISGRASARSVTASATCAASVEAERRNLRRAGQRPEQVAHLDRRPARVTHVAQVAAPPVGDLDLGARRLALGARPHHELGHGRDRRQRLAAEPVRRDPLQVVELPQLRRGVPLERQLARRPGSCPCRRRAPARAWSPVLDLDVHGARPRVERVLDQLLHDGRRPLHHLAGGDLVDEVVGKSLDAVQ